MNRNEAFAILKGPLKFGDATQIEALKYLEKSIDEKGKLITTCEECNGSGTVEAECDACDGTGKIKA